MKKTICSLFVFAIFVACNSVPTTQSNSSEVAKMPNTFTIQNTPVEVKVELWRNFQPSSPDNISEKSLNASILIKSENVDLISNLNLVNLVFNFSEENWQILPAVTTITPFKTSNTIHLIAHGGPKWPSGAQVTNQFKLSDNTGQEYDFELTVEITETH